MPTTVSFMKYTFPVAEFWEPLVTPCFRSELQQVESDLLSLGTPVVPDPALVLRFLGVSKVSVVILGQDPYSAKGKATGRAFEVGTVSSWHDNALDRQNDSLFFILQALHRLDRDLPQGAELEDIRQDRTFRILPPNDLFQYWEQQGVLLLNTAFTCTFAKPGSNLVIWAPAITAVLRHLRRHNPVWFLWGGKAQAYQPLLHGQTIYTECHPSPLGKSEDKRFGHTASCFTSVESIDWLGHRCGAEPIHSQR